MHKFSSFPFLAWHGWPGAPIIVKFGTAELTIDLLLHATFHLGRLTDEVW